MKKIPVGATIAHAYRFVFANALAVFKAVWLPLAAQLVVVFLFTGRMAFFLAAAEAHDPSAASAFGPLMLLLPLIFLFLAAQLTAVTELALGRPPQSWIAFHFGKPMWQLAGRMLAAILIIAVIATVGALALLLIGSWLDLLLKSAPGLRLALVIVALLLLVAYFCAIALLLVRFLFLLAPVSLAEQRGIGRAWTLSAGNFWRIFLIALAILLPCTIIQYVYVFSVAGLPQIPVGATKEVRDAARTAWQIPQLNAMASRWYLTLPLTGLLMFFQFGAGCAAQAFAYRKLTESADLSPVAGDGLP